MLLSFSLIFARARILQYNPFAYQWTANVVNISCSFPFRGASEG